MYGVELGAWAWCLLCATTAMDGTLVSKLTPRFWSVVNAYSGRPTAFATPKMSKKILQSTVFQRFAL